MAMEEVLGEEGVRRVLDSCGDGRGAEQAAGWALFPIGQYMEPLEQVYGTQVGRGLALRVGRACFPYSLREYGETLGLTNTSFRLLPFRKKLQNLTTALSELLRQSAGQDLMMELSDGTLLWHIEGCPICHGRHTDEPACHMAVGLAEESLYWLSGGKMFQVEESTCIARGDPQCTLRIDLAPLF
jgi:predicted hydrocarbon binding protein